MQLISERCFKCYRCGYEIFLTYSKDKKHPEPTDIATMCYSIRTLIAYLEDLLKDGFTTVTEEEFASLFGKYECRCCGKKFIRKEDLREHELAIAWKQESQI
jgi:hypothetical protein